MINLDLKYKIEAFWNHWGRKRYVEGYFKEVIDAKIFKASLESTGWNIDVYKLEVKEDGSYLKFEMK